MKNLSSLSILFPMICFMVFGCNKTRQDKETNFIDASDILGIWSMDVQNGNLKGEEEINLLSSNNLMVKDSLIFTGEDSGFSFMLPINVNLEGNWRLQKDSLFIKYRLESIDIKADEDNLIINNSQENADLKVLESLKQEMGDKLIDYVASYLTDSYERVSDQELLLGKIIYHNADTLLLRINDNQFYMTR